ncbi:unnamed protein product, partial [Amoebophrya sp. A25]
QQATEEAEKAAAEDDMKQQRAEIVFKEDEARENTTNFTKKSKKIIAGYQA